MLSEDGVGWGSLQRLAGSSPQFSIIVCPFRVADLNVPLCSSHAGLEVAIPGFGGAAVAHSQAGLEVEPIHLSGSARYSRC